MANVTGVITEFFEHKGTEFIKDMYHGAQIASMVTRYPGIDGKLTMPSSSIDKPLLRGYDGKAEAEDDTVVIEGVTMSTTMHKFFLELDLGDDTMRAYKNYLKENGMSSDDFSVVEYFAEDVQLKQHIAVEIDQAACRGKALFVQTDGKPIIETVNGFRRLIKNAAALTTPRAKVVTTGVLSNTTTLAGFETVFMEVNETLQAMGLAIVCGYNLYNKYILNYFTARGGNSASEEKVYGTTYSGSKFHLGGGNSFVIPLLGMGNDDAFFITPIKNLAYLYDAETAVNNLEVQKQGFKHHLLTRMPVGFGVKKMSQKMVYCNDRLIATS